MEHSVLLLVKNNGANVITECAFQCQKQKYKLLHFNKPDAAFKTFLGHILRYLPLFVTDYILVHSLANKVRYYWVYITKYSAWK